jgi:hypothetical protein
MQQGDVRRIIAVEAHRRRSGRCPVLVHSLGTGESFDIRPTPDGFVDIASGVAVRVSGERLLLSDDRRAVDLHLSGDIAFDGYDHISNERFSGRAGGGASVTIYDSEQVNYFQYAVAAEGDRY